MDVKQFLKNYRDRYDEIDAADDMVQSLVQKSQTPSIRMDGPKVSYTHNDDKISMYVYQLDAARARLQKLVDKQNKDQAIIERAVALLPTVRKRDVIRYRYLMGLKWRDVNERMFGRMDDFEDREESYLRRTTKAHGAALREIDPILNDLLTSDTGKRA